PRLPSTTEVPLGCPASALPMSPARSRSPEILAAERLPPATPKNVSANRRQPRPAACSAAAGVRRPRPTIPRNSAKFALRFPRGRGSVCPRELTVPETSEGTTSMAIHHEIAALQRLTVQQLRARYAEVYGEGTAAQNKAWLVKRIAY